MYQAVAQSLNLPAVWLLHEMGLSKGYNKPPADLSSEPQLDTSVRHLGKCHHSFSLCNKIVVKSAGGLVIA
jgi:membrane peptidoglycan carboxypeptidase